MSSGGRRRGGNPNFSSEDQALNMIAREAEARLAAKRASRAEARSIRMKELERQQKEADERMDKEYKLNLLVDDIPKKRVIQRAPESDSGVSRNTDAYVKSLQDSLREVEDNYKKAMVSNAQLDNEKQALSYQVDYLKDRLGDEEENVHNLMDELTQLNRVYNNLTRSNERTVDELERFKYVLAERDKILEEYGINTDGTRNVDHEQQQQPASLPNGVDALPLDVIDAVSLDKASFKSQSSVSSTTTSEDRDLLLEQIKSLKDEVAELRRENESEAFQLQDMAVDELRPDVGIDKRLTETVATVDSCELERSTFVDVSDEARAIDDDIDQAPPDESTLLASGTVVNNNEKNDDFEVIDTTLNHPNAVSQFEDASYESSARFTESMDSAVLLSEAHVAAVADDLDSDSIDANRNEESSSPAHLITDDAESIVVTQSQSCYYSDFDIVDEDPSEKGQKTNHSKKINHQMEKDAVCVNAEDEGDHVIVAEHEDEPEQVCKDNDDIEQDCEGLKRADDYVEQDCEESEQDCDDVEQDCENLEQDCDILEVTHETNKHKNDDIMQENSTPLDLGSPALTATGSLANEDGACLNDDKDDDDHVSLVPPPTDGHKKESVDILQKNIFPAETATDSGESKYYEANDEDDDGKSKDGVIPLFPTEMTGKTFEMEQTEPGMICPQKDCSSIVMTTTEAISNDSPTTEDTPTTVVEAISDQDKEERRNDDNTLDAASDDDIIQIPLLNSTKDSSSSSNSAEKPIKILKAVKGKVPSHVPLKDDVHSATDDKTSNSNVVVVVDPLALKEEDDKSTGDSNQQKEADDDRHTSHSTDVNWEISVEKSPPPVPKERTKKKKKKRKKSKDLLQPDDRLENKEEEKQAAAKEPTMENRPVSIIVDTADDAPCSADEDITKTENEATVVEMVDTQSAASNSPLLLDIESRGASNSLSESSDIDCPDDEVTAGGNSDNEAPRKRSKSKRGSKKDSKKEGCKSQ